MKSIGIFLFPFSLSFLSCFCITAQTKPSEEEEETIYKRTFSDDLLNQLKATQTVFFYKTNDINALDSFKQAITSAWDLTPIVFDEIGNFDKYASNPKYSYFVIEGTSTTVSSSTNSYSSLYYYLALRLYKGVGKKDKIVTDALCRIEMYPDNESLFLGTAPHRKGVSVIDTLYKKGIFYNWSPVLLKANLEVVSKNLKNNLRPKLFDDFQSDDLQQLLSKDTLYVPKTLLMTFNKFSGKENEADESMFAAYKHNYKICSDAELYKIFQTEKRGRLLFEYVKSSSNKLISIYDLKEGKVVYRRYKTVSYNLKEKDIEKID